jgi:hypothetical protein
MPRYFFNVTDGKSYPDTEGTELPDLDAARGEAFRTLGDILKNKDTWQSGEWQIDIADVDGQGLLKLMLNLREIPA